MYILPLSVAFLCPHQNWKKLPPATGANLCEVPRFGHKGKGPSGVTQVPAPAPPRTLPPAGRGSIPGLRGASAPEAGSALRAQRFQTAA